MMFTLITFFSVINFNINFIFRKRSKSNYIKTKRKEENLTQSDLAEKLNITDRAISKWENGNCLPDAGTMPELCKILNISINDLFSGEIVDMKDNEKKLEENLIEMAKLKEEKDRQLLALEFVIGYTASITFMTLIFGMGNAIKIEQVAGYYECSKCHHKYVPKYSSVLWSMHINRTRYMKCPKCNQKSWQKKVISK